MAFYGTGGTEDQIKAALTSPKYRPTGHDCNTQGTFRFDYNQSFIILSRYNSNNLYLIVFICAIKSLPHQHC